MIVCLLAAFAATACDRQKAEEPQAPAGESQQVKGVDRSQRGKPSPVTVFRDPDGGTFTLSKFRGTPLLVNLWASWCAPCIKELPTLQQLESAHAGDGRLAVIAVSQDMAPQGSVDAFLAERDLGRFAAYHDPEMGLSSALGTQILPTTILYDAGGKEVWRYVGDLDWTGPEATKLLAEASGARARESEGN
ncbi:TlpA family protein disulfide reductase [Sphingomonas xanthus]|uniref:TlpA family protein disulfide reductase n=1 Tax=Sphingomonas xanthus TaxID=2594473 RepID=A0A516IUG2_9SPHN|nr:TlpA family protein disulfide reductase [Sphingomonas xanthus]